MINRQRVFGILLGYPECCIEHFETGGGFYTNGNVAYNGFVPCPEHAKLSYTEIVELIGRDLKEAPEPINELMLTFNEKKFISKLKELGLYEQVEREISR